MFRSMHNLRLWHRQLLYFQQKRLERIELPVGKFLKIQEELFFS